ncbi:hypothetical protein [Virgibacillus proomii]|uniref:hypothetical protein n=1 Tax=Virgibacillus proomii TaxID=84407 RepID=UPI00098556BD|nr:hypothetical protein [Virgibacillus proomii]
MINNLVFNNKYVSWSFKNKEVKIEIEDIIIATENNINNYVVISSGKNFITEKVFYHHFDGSLLMFYNLKTGLIQWEHNKNDIEITVDSLIQVGYYPYKKLILIMYKTKDREVIALDLKGDYLYEVSPPNGYKMMYFQEFTDHISIVCDGDDKHQDKFGRNRVNFKLDILNGNLTKGNLA